MTTHKYPAVSSPQAQETRQDIIDRLQRYMELWERTAQSWERQSHEWEQKWRDVTNELNRVRAERDTAVAEQGRIMRGMMCAGRELDAANARIAELGKKTGSLNMTLETLDGLAGHPDEGLVEWIENIQRQLAETQQALAVAEQT